ncbi:hypothetical protein CQW23_32375 [Capsicum baccatum]|uniref:Uncharacterized protein n=1 Tax=Capsicum baccatum TaxID=33114 RepID=A0A2G2V4Z4_CAPBA|nr:hypothetical protein CQW23_32375 [Capsicum baccatum]
MTEHHLVELFDAILMYLQYLPKYCSEMIIPSMTQYGLLQNLFGNLRDFHELKVNGCIKYETIEYVLPQLQLMAYRVVNFYYTLLGYQLDESDVPQVDSKLAKPVELETLHICSTNVKASKSAEVAIPVRNLEENSMDEENMKETSSESQDLLEDIDVLKEDLRNVFLEAPTDSSELCFPMSDGPLFITLLLKSLNDLLNSKVYSVVLKKEEIGWVKEDLE